MKSHRKHLLSGLLLAGILSLAGCGGSGGGGGQTDPNGPTPGSGTTFTTVDLQGVGGQFSVAVAINDAGLAVGYADGTNGLKGAEWNVGDSAPAATLLQPLPGNNHSAAYGVNDFGIRVGESEVGADTTDMADDRTVAVFWSSGSTEATALSTVGLFQSGASAALSISDDGLIVGEAAYDSIGNTVAVMWPSTSSDPVILSHLSADAEAFSSASFIGEDAVVVGESRNDEGEVQAVVWSPGPNGGYLDPTALSVLSASQVASAAYGRDEAGRIVGEVELASGEVHGIIWNTDGSIAADLGSNTTAQAINNADILVGHAEVLSGNDQTAFWNADYPSIEPNLGVPFSQAYGINNYNQIVGLRGWTAFVALPVQP
ncbi:hypothetical protein MJO47_06040 [Desulfuromonas sp. KJ2020]|uniref:hypothetical protein n=1 Tax=Desulfuromonas sp. KJ2020 TaxID=2919173 RepID=UPI0020A7076D|nr:hypothetical protein [Desulfuromonas sp. KJ2020]MCP3176657.1 hypothetical protein [Desulfuromonas sp. KJ2020]